MKNSASTAYGAKGLSSSKWLLLACAASAAVVDIIIIALLAAGGEAGEYLACPILLLIFDVFYFAVSLFFTNFRFKYSIFVWVSYIALYTVGLFIGLAIILGDGSTVLSGAAVALWACVHAFNILCAVVCALFASRVIRKTWLAAAVAAVFLAGVIAYAGFMFSVGFFGQGRGSRTLVYDNYGDNTYAVTGVLAGKSDKITVPSTFNGKPVTAVSLSVFAEKGVKEFNLPDSITDIVNTDAVSGDMNLKDRRIKINVDKKSVNVFREKFLNCAGGSYTENAVKLANAVLPVNLAENEGYVAFNYDTLGCETVRGNVIPVYVGDLEDFDFNTYTAGFDYVVHRQDGSAENLYWAFDSSGYILADTGISGEVTKSTVAELKFERVYRIMVDGGNDEKYDVREKQPELCYDNVGGSSEYKYVSESMAETFLSGLTPRKGFTNRWLCYEKSPAQDGKYFTDFAGVIKDDITISTRWELEKPVVTLSTSALGNTITYGDDVTISSAVKHGTDGIKTEYRWTFNDEMQTRWATQNVSLTHPKPSDYSGTFRLTVVVGGDEITSLGAVATASIDLKINRKRVTFNWDMPEDDVYDGTVKTVSVTLDDSQQVEGDPVNFNCTGMTSFKNAGTYDFGMRYDSITDLNYELIDCTNHFTLKPRPVAVDWANFTNLIYNGSVQSPTATATGVPADGELPVSVSGGNKNAGGHVARASISDGNYAVTNPEQPFTIERKALTATVGGASVVYGDKLGNVNVTYAGFADGENESYMKTKPAFYTVPAIGDNDYNVGTFEGGVRCNGFNAGNYSVAVEDITYGRLTVTPRTVNIAWGIPVNLVYDGNSKNVTASVGNKLPGDDVALTVSGGNGVTADAYTATVTAIAGADAANYRLPAAVTTNYTITKRTATVVWSAPQEPVYDGMEHAVNYTVQNLVAGDEQYLAGGFKYENAGEYEFSVLSGGASEDYINQNYNMINGSIKFTVQPARGEVEFFVNRISYDDYDTAVKVGDTISWQANSNIWSVNIYRNGEVVNDSTVHPMVLIGSLSGSYQITAAGDYVFEIDVGGNNGNTTRRTINFKISGVVDGGGRNDVV